MHENWTKQKSVVWRLEPKHFDEGRVDSQYSVMRSRFPWSRTWLALAIGAALNLSLSAQTAAEKKQPPEARWEQDILAFEAADKTRGIVSA